MKQKILVLLPAVPFPLNSGGNQGTFHSIDVLRDYFDITIIIKFIDKRENYEALKKVWNDVTFKDIKCDKNTSRYIKWVTFFKKKVDMFYKNDVTAQIINRFKDNNNDTFIKIIREEAYRNKYDYIQVEYLSLLNIVHVLPENAKKIFVHHEIGYVVNEQKYADVNDSYINYLVSKQKTWEIGTLNKYDAVITVSKVDAHKLKCDGAITRIYPSFSIISPHPEAKKTEKFNNVLSFVGPESHLPNKVGLLCFLDKCWGDIKKRHPELKIHIIGNWTQETIHSWRLLYQDVFFCGFVEDLYSALKGTVMIVPLNIGSGIRMKLLEASNMHIPFISTRIGVEGLPFIDEIDGIITNNIEDMALRMDLIYNQDVLNKYANSAYQKVVSVYSKEALKESKLKIFAEIKNV